MVVAVLVLDFQIVVEVSGTCYTCCLLPGMRRNAYIVLRSMYLVYVCLLFPGRTPVPVGKLSNIVKHRQVGKPLNTTSTRGWRCCFAAFRNAVHFKFSGVVVARKATYVSQDTSCIRTRMNNSTSANNSSSTIRATIAVSTTTSTVQVRVLLCQLSTEEDGAGRRCRTCRRRENRAF